MNQHSRSGAAMMELLEAVETQSLTKIKALMKSKNIFLDKNSLSDRVLMRAFAYERKDLISFLLESHCSVNAVMKTYAFTTTPLHCAIKLRSVDLIEEILKKDPSIAAVDSDGNSALHLAFLQKHEEAVDFILTYIEQKSKYANPRNENGLTHMHIACTRKNTNVINGFLEEKVDLQDSVSDISPYFASYTAWHFAAEFGSLEALRILKNFKVAEPKNDNSNRKTLWQIVNENLQDLMVMTHLLKDKNEDEICDSKTYFIFACLRKDPSLLKKFIDNGVNVNGHFDKSPLNTFWDSPLHLAVKGDHRTTVELLLQHGADIGYRNYHSMTPLHLALYHDHSKKSEIVDLLYKAVENIDVNVEDRNGLGHFQVAVAKNDLDMVKTFLVKGVDVNKFIKPNLYKFSHLTPLHIAVLYQHTEMARLLIENGANVNLAKEGNLNSTPLHLAFLFGYKDLIELLLKYGANPKLVTADGDTTLHLLLSNFRKNESQQALLSFDTQTILMYLDQLVKLGVDINAQNEEGETALHKFQWDDDECLPYFQLLLELGADINLEANNRYLPFNLLFYMESLCDSAKYLMFYHHVQKLKALGLYVHPDNEGVCEWILDDLQKLGPSGKGFRTEELACRQRQRIDKIARLKRVMITPYMSLYHFLKLEPKRAATYLPNDVLEEMLMQKDFDKTYPSYGYLIRLQYQRNSSNYHARDFDKRTDCSEADQDSPTSKRQRLE